MAKSMFICAQCKEHFNEDEECYICQPCSKKVIQRFHKEECWKTHLKAYHGVAIEPEIFIIPKNIRMHK